MLKKILLGFYFCLVTTYAFANYYPKEGASYSYPEKKFDGERVYACSTNWPGIYFKFDSKVPLKECVDAAMSAYASYDGPIKLGNCELQPYGDPKYDQYRINCDKLNGWPAGKTFIMQAHSFSTKSYMSCPNPKEPTFTIGYPTSDSPLRCYHPDDVSLLPVLARESCNSEKKAFTLSSKEEEAIKSAAKVAKENLEQMSSDLALPSALNGEKLNQIASLFGMENYHAPQFAILTSAINASSLGCIKNRLAAAELDPSGNGYLSFEASANGGSGVYCKSKTGNDIIQLNVKDLNIYHPVYKNDELQELIVHEVKHACNDFHPDKMHYMTPSAIRQEFEEDIADYKRLIGTGNELDILERLIQNPYYFEYLLRIYL